MNCSQCESELLVEIFGTSNPIRCASCGGISIPANEASTQAGRFAWRSLWLGIASIFLLFLTGLPAIWYGVRSLLQMRFVRSQKGDRKAAAAGITLGLLFGIFGSDDFQTDDARVMKNTFQRVEWRDGFTAEDANGRIRLIKAIPGTQIGDSQIFGPKLEFDIHRDIDVDNELGERESVSWPFAGKTRTIVKISEPVLKGDFRTVRYVGSTEEDKSGRAYILAISVRENGKYSQDDVRQVFESFQPNDSE